MTRISEADYRALLKGSSGNHLGIRVNQSKYKNEKPTYYDPELKETLKFDSNKELEYYFIFKDKQKRGEITDLERQVSIEIQPSFITPSGEKIRAITYIADFTYYDRGGFKHYIDVKGFKTEVYKLKYKLLAYQGIYIEEV